VIVGGESGPGARPFHLEHAREIIRRTARRATWWYEEGNAPRARAARAYLEPPAVFVKQLGAKPRYLDDLTIGVYKEKPLPLRDRKGGDWSEWPADLRIREFPDVGAPRARPTCHHRDVLVPPPHRAGVYA
jgi:hypothetical protein